METFKLKARQDGRRGQVWELRMVPGGTVARSDADTTLLGSCAVPETLSWLRDVADDGDMFEQAEPPKRLCDFRPGSSVVLRHEDGMRLALAFKAAASLGAGTSKADLRDRVLGLPAEVLLYWFTLCFYGRRQSAGCKALRSLLTTDDDKNGKAR